MGFSFRADKRMAGNAQHPVAKAMMGTARHYGFNDGSREKLQLMERLMAEYEVACGVDYGFPAFRQDAAKRTIGSKYPVAVDAAWTVANQLDNDVVVRITKQMGGLRSVITMATFFTDAFPERHKRTVFDLKVSGWQSLAAIAAQLLAQHGLENGLDV